eukprot:8130878-Pyramimonas_sp.AAC.1
MGVPVNAMEQHCCALLLGPTACGKPDACWNGARGNRSCAVPSDFATAVHAGQRSPAWCPYL